MSKIHDGMIFTAFLAFFCIFAIDNIALGQSGGELKNAGFESATPHQNWSLHVYDAQPSVTLDKTIRRAGQQSLRV